MTQNNHTDNKPCIVCVQPIGPRTTQKVIELAQLCLRFGRVERVTYHEDGKRLETDTDHTVMLAVIACAFAERINAEDARFPRYDVGLVAQFAIVHDLVEAYAGDTNTLDSTGGATRTKEAREAAALARIRSEFAADFPWLTDTIDEYESLISPEARFVKALDKVLPKITHLLNGGATLRQHGVDASNIDAVNGSQVAKMRVTYAADQPAVMALYADVHARLREALVKQQVSDEPNESDCALRGGPQQKEHAKHCGFCRAAEQNSAETADNEREATDERIDAHGGVLEYLGNYAVFNVELTPDRTRLFLVDGCDAVFAVWLQKQHVARLIAELQALHDQMPDGEGKSGIAKQNAALRECVTYARSKRGKDFDFDTWEAMCEAAMAGEHVPSALENEIALHAQTRDALIAVRKERDALIEANWERARKFCVSASSCKLHSVEGTGTIRIWDASSVGLADVPPLLTVVVKGGRCNVERQLYNGLVVEIEGQVSILWASV